MTLNVKAAKRRLAIMAMVNVSALGLAVPALYFYVRHGVVWGLAAFVALLSAGIGAQIWFIASLRRASKGA